MTDAQGTPTAYVHIKDLLDLSTPEVVDAPIPADRIRPLITIRPEVELEDALATIRARGTHIARVADANDQTTGALFLEDILEELIGEVQDATRR